jgi:hypothetical protein
MGQRSLCEGKRTPTYYLKTMRIQKHIGEDILQWGTQGIGICFVKQAYHLEAKFHMLEKDPIWDKIWNMELWPKIASFLWLLIKRKTLTWDRLLK